MLLPKGSTGHAPDRRRRPRLSLAYRLLLSRCGEASQTETKTENISCEGFYCTSERLFSAGDMLECELVISGHGLSQSGEHDMVLRCWAEVVRVVPRAGGTACGVACRFADYTVDLHTVEQDVVEELSLTDLAPA